MNQYDGPETPEIRALGWTCSGLFTPRDAANLRRFNIWAIGLALTYVVSTLTIVSRVAPPFVRYILVAITLGLGLTSVRSYVFFLRNADELLRKIQLEAIAIGFSSGLVFLLTWRLLELLGAPAIHGSIAVAVLLIMWAVGQRMGIRHYTERS